MRQTEYVILGLLSESPLSGYQMKQLIDIRFRFFWNESYGQLYPTLKELKARGLIEELGGTAVSNARAQRTYQISEEGVASLKEWLEKPPEKETVRLEILLKMYFSNLVPPEVMAGHIRAFQESHERDLQMLNLFQHELEAIADQDPNHPHVLSVINFGQKVNQAYVDWSRETIKFLESRYTK
jgi:PadR family transcriptional regulator, regulatory protein AphA